MMASKSKQLGQEGFSNLTDEETKDFEATLKLTELYQKCVKTMTCK